MQNIHRKISKMFTTGASLDWIPGAYATKKKEEFNGIVKVILKDIFENVLICLLILTNLLILVF